MAKIIKVGSQNPTFTSKANLAKTSRVGNPFKHSERLENPFKYANFEGNTLPFADVFEGFQPKSTNKLRMIASSVAGSMNKMKSGFAEPIINFVRRVRDGVSSAWDYAKKTPFSEVPGIREVNAVLNTPIEIKALSLVSESVSNAGKNITSKMSDLSKGVSEKMGYLNKDIKDVGKDISAQWSALIAKIPSKRSYSDMSVEEIRDCWLKEIELGSEAA